MKKRILAFLMAVAMLAVSGMLTSCNLFDRRQVAPEFEMPEGGYDGSEVEITFYHTMGQNLRPVLQKYIAKFNEIYPNITVKEDQVGGYDDVRNQISTEITVGNQPNIAYCYPDHVALFNLSGAVQTLDPLIDSGIDGICLTDEQKADFIEGYYNEGKQFGDGKMYTMPFLKSTEVLYYNKTFFEANNLTPPTTWDEMEALCRRIKEIDPGSIPLGYDSEANWFITMCEQLGSDYTSATGDKFLFDNETNREFVKRFRSWYKEGLMTTQTLYGAYTSGLFIEQSPEKAKSYMSIGSSAGATHQRPAKVDNEYPFEVGITTVPQANADNKKVISQGPSVCIFKKSNPQEVLASWLLVRYLITNVEFQAEFSIASGYVPVLKSVKDNAVYNDFLSQADGGDFVAALSAKICMEQEDYYYTSPAFNGSSKARDMVGDLMCGCFTEANDAGIDDFIKRAFEDAVDECEYFAS